DRFGGSGGPLLAPSTTGFPFCTTADTPTFSFGFAALFDALGTDMGDPTECAHIDVASGDTYQQTTKGLAVYHHATNVPSFSSSPGQWQVAPDGRVGPPAQCRRFRLRRRLHLPLPPRHGAASGVRRSASCCQCSACCWSLRSSWRRDLARWPCQLMSC